MANNAFKDLIEGWIYSTDDRVLANMSNILNLIPSTIFKTNKQTRCGGSWL